MTNQSLAKMERVALREVWPDEARDFTPWLAEHIAELGDALGFSLETVEPESRVGRRSLDILARDTSSGHTVIIENQLESSDGDHLSRLLVYGAGKDADVVVWIASEFDDEHRQALQWLNERTRTQFFGVAIELWKIDNSRPALHFRVIAAPNDWRKRRANYEREVMKRKVRDFRIGLEEKLRRERHLVLEPVSDSDSWLHIKVADGLYYTVEFFVDDWISIFLQMNTQDNRSLEWCHAAFDRLEKDKNVIEKKLGQLEWDRHWQHSEGSYIASYYPGGTLSELSTDSWDEVYDWVVKSCRRFRAVFEPYREELAAARVRSRPTRR